MWATSVTAKVGAASPTEAATRSVAPGDTFKAREILIKSYKIFDHNSLRNNHYCKYFKILGRAIEKYVIIVSALSISGTGAGYGER